MNIYLLSRVGRWLAAASIAVAGVCLSAREGRATQQLYTYLTVTNPNCNQDASGNYYTSEAFGITSAGAFACTAGQSAQVVNSAGYGSTAGSLCGLSGSGAATVQFVFGGSINAASGAFTEACESPTVSFTTSTSCPFTTAVRGGCGAGNSMTVVSYGTNF